MRATLKNARSSSTDIASETEGRDQQSTVRSVIPFKDPECSSEPAPMVIATGCPHSGWEKVLPILYRAGLEPAGDNFSRWHDELFHSAGRTDPLLIRQSLGLAPEKDKSGAELSADSPQAPILLADSRSLWFLDFWAATLPQATFLLFYSRAEAALAHACGAGIEPLKLLQSWQAASRQVLQFQRRHRRRAFLLDAEAAWRNPRALGEVCQRIGLVQDGGWGKDDGGWMTDDGRQTTGGGGDGLDRFFAAQLVGAHPDVLHLQTELEASAQPLGEAEVAAPLPAEEFFNSYFALRTQGRRLWEELEGQHTHRQQLHQQIHELSASRDEQANLAAEFKEQLERLQPALQDRNAALASVQEELNRQNDELGRHKWYLGERDAEIVRLNEHLAGREAELDGVRHEWLAQKETLEQLHQAQQEHLAQLDALHATLTRLGEEHASLTRTLSERDVAVSEARQLLLERDAEMARLTAENRTQLEQERQALQTAEATNKETARENERLLLQLHQVQQDYQTLESERKEAEKENELLLLQLHQVQEELETTFLQKQAIEQAQEDRDTQQQQLHAQINQLTQAKDEQTKLSTERQARLEQVRRDKDTQQQQLHAQINQLTQAKDEQAKLSTEGQAQLEQVRRDKDKQRQQLQAQIDQLTQARDAQAKQKAQRDSQLEQARQACQTLEASQKETEKENELLLLQLHQVQEELETIFLRNQNLKQAHQQLEASQQEVAQANEVLVQELQQVNQALGAKDGEIEKQRQRVTRLKQTVSWKVTAPLRVMAKPFNASIKEQKKAQKQIELLKSSGHFDAAWYLAENEDVAKMSADPVEHYISHGAAEGRNPSPAFNTQRYLEINPDVAETGINPLVHFVKYGMAEGRAVSNGA